VEELELRANGLQFAALADGPPNGPLVLLLHGFPELGRSWRHQLPALAGAGYRAVAPDLRGFGGTDARPPYDLDTLSLDVVALVHALGHERATLVGHDWGATLAWAAAARHPWLVERLVVLNGPPVGALLDEVLRSPVQLRRSSYVVFFQLPLVAERAIAKNGAAGVARALRGGSHVREAWPPEELAPYRAAFARPGRAAAALGWYRAARRHALRERRISRAAPVAAPTLVVWGARDRFLGVGLTRPRRLAPYLAHGNEPTTLLLEEAGHFVQNEAPRQVNDALLRWLGAPP
jgi:pimeloyl-ACP methyl ester carboxylesterase